MENIPKSAFKPKTFAYFRRVEAGETLVITDHGKPVAKIVPYRGEEAMGALQGILASYRHPTEPVAQGDWETGG